MLSWQVVVTVILIKTKKPPCGVLGDFRPVFLPENISSLNLHFMKIYISRHGKVDLIHHFIANKKKKATWYVSIIWQTGHIASDLYVCFHTESSLLCGEVYWRNVGFKIGENVAKIDSGISAGVRGFSTCNCTWPRYFRRPRANSGRNSFCAVMVKVNPGT
jgi:hypothetical protein